MMPRDLLTIDAQLRKLVAVRRSVTEQGGPAPSIAPLDALLDEGAATAPRQSGWR